MSCFCLEGRGRPGFVEDVEEVFWDRREDRVDVNAREVEVDISLDFGLDFWWCGKREAFDVILCP